MLKRDYLLKLVQDLFAAINQLLTKDIDEVERQREIQALYTQFGENANFFRSAETADIVATVARTAADAQGVQPDELSAAEMEQRLDLLATLMYADFKSSQLTDGLRRDVAARALDLTLMINESSDTYSFERLGRIGELQKFLAQSTN